MFSLIQNDHVHYLSSKYSFFKQYSSTVCRLFERRIRGLQGSGHVEKMADDRLPKRATALREQGRRRRGRPRLRWEDCVKRDVKRGGRLEGEDKRQSRVEKTIR